MTSPLKPWEKNIPVNLNNGTTTNNEPPLPPRPNTNSVASNYYGNRYNSPYSYSSPYSYNHNPYGYNGFGQNFGYFGSGIGGYPGYGNPSNEFSIFRLAEESSRQAFQSIESIVQAFSSISMLLESTYFALRNSFQAIISVADNFSTLRNHLTRIMSTLAILRMLKNFVNYVLSLIGLRKQPSIDESVWASTDTTNNENIPLNSQLNNVNNPTWPLMIFFGLVCGTPWIVWKLLNQESEQEKINKDKWKTGQGAHYVAVALFDFNTENEQEVPFKSGQLIRVASKELQPNTQGWLLAHVNDKTGLVPANRIKIIKYLDQKATESENLNQEPLVE